MGWAGFASSSPSCDLVAASAEAAAAIGLFQQGLHCAGVQVAGKLLSPRRVLAGTCHVVYAGKSNKIVPGQPQVSALIACRLRGRESANDEALAVVQSFFRSVLPGPIGGTGTDRSNSQYESERKSGHGGPLIMSIGVATDTTVFAGFNKGEFPHAVAEQRPGREPASAHLAGSIVTSP